MSKVLSYYQETPGASEGTVNHGTSPNSKDRLGFLSQAVQLEYAVS